MNSVIKKAVDIFSKPVYFEREHSDWITANIRKIVEDLYALSEGEQVNLASYVKDNFGEDKVKVVMNSLMPYLTGPYGVLDLSFETASGKKVEVRSYLENKELGKCISEDGEEISSEDVLVIFRRNERREITTEKGLGYGIK